MHMVISLEKWTPVEEGNPGKVKTSATVTVDGQVDVVEELIRLLRKAGYTVS